MKIFIEVFHFRISTRKKLLLPFIDHRREYEKKKGLQHLAGFYLYNFYRHIKTFSSINIFQKPSKLNFDENTCNRSTLTFQYSPQ